MSRFLALVALLLAIPTWGISLLIYFLARYLFGRYGRGGSIEELSLIEQAVLFVGVHHNGSIVGTSVNEISFSDVVIWLVRNGIKSEMRGDDRDMLEFQLRVAGNVFDVCVTHEPSGEGAIFKVISADGSIDALYQWFREVGANQCLSKFFLPLDGCIILGSATMPEWRPDGEFRVPVGIARLTNLKVLGLINKNIIELPRSIGSMSSLEELKLGGNDLAELPDEVCNLHQLRILTLWGNSLKRLPEKIGNLRHLEGLDISMNDLRSLPESIIEIDTLQRFYLCDNEKLLLSERQEKWLAGLMASGVELIMDKALEERLKSMRPQAIAA